jgi:DNA excision repair protein ERCC-2
VLQAAGRVIRSEQDRGVVLLIDQRYAQQRYRTLLPSHWHVQVAGAALESDNIVDRFWNECP